MFKNSFKLLVVSIALFGAVGASADHKGSRFNAFSMYRADLTRWTIDPQLYFANSIDGGTVVLNLSSKTLDLTLFTAMPRCLPPRMCPMYMPAPIMISLPIVSVRTDDCGTVIVKAREDRRPVDGGLQTLVLRENGMNHCPSFVARPGTEVVYKTESAGMSGYIEKTRSTFEGDILREEIFYPLAR